MEGPMHGRVTVVGVVVLVLAGVCASRAIAGTWADAAADPRIGFPVYAPAQALGLHASVRRLACGGGPTDPYSIVAGYAGHGSRARVSLYEASPERCGDPGEAMTVERVTIGGRRVPVAVFCHHAGCAGGVTRAQGFRHGFLLSLRKPGGVVITIMTSHVRLAAVLRLARSLQPITRPKGPWPAVHLNDFLSPDGSVWCQIGTAGELDRAWCATDNPQRSAQLTRDGSVQVCSDPVCTQDWGTTSPRLHAGQSSRLGPYRCTGQTAGMTCAVTSGRGFTIDGSGVTLVAPTAAAARTVYFFASPFGLLPGQFVIKPKVLPIFVDGRWVLDRLRWTHWGATATTATGRSVSSDAVSGQSVRTWARVTLSRPGRFAGHTVYRCVAVKVPPPADFGPKRCLKGKGASAYFG
jgi:hypothetical protein